MSEDNYTLSQQEKKIYGGLLREAFEAAVRFNGDDASLDSFIETLSQVEDFVKDKNNGVYSAELAANFSHQAGYRGRCTIEDILDTAIVNAVKFLNNADKTSDVIDFLKFAGSTVIDNSDFYLPPDKIDPPPVTTGGNGNTTNRKYEPRLSDGGACIDVKDVRLTGITLYKLEEFTPTINSYINKCLNLSQINSLTEDITNFYIERGYITTRTYIPAQNLTNGILELTIIEGTLEGIKYPFHKSEVDAAFPNLLGSALNLRDFEQGLDQINRLKSNNAEISLTPGNENGSSIVQIKNDKTKPWHVRTGIDNSGLEATGEEQAFVNFDYDNLLNINDLLSLSFKYDLDGRDRRQSRNISGRYEAVYGYWNFSYALNYFDYISEITTGTANFKTSGFSRIHDLSVSRVLHRDQKSRTSFSGGLTAKENKNFIEDILLDASSQELTVLNFGLSRSQQIDNGFLFGAVNYNKGIGLFGAQEDNGLAIDEPQAEFERITADISAAKILNVGWNQYNPRIDLRARGQWSADTLFGSEQISLGGPFSVRGFQEASISGDRGAYGRLDLSMPYSFTSPPQIKKLIGTLRPYVGFDQGVIKSDNSNPIEGGLLRSWTVGLKNEGGLLDFELSYSKPISSPSFNGPESHDLFFTASIKF